MHRPLPGILTSPPALKAPTPLQRSEPFPTLRQEGGEDHPTLSARPPFPGAAGSSSHPCPTCPGGLGSSGEGKLELDKVLVESLRPPA